MQILQALHYLHENVPCFSLNQKEGHARLLWSANEHPSPSANPFFNYELQIWLANITSRDAQSACCQEFKTSCDLII